jgi:CRP/FNR family transcriptional regulator, anaerobic regulatory protein
MTELEQYIQSYFGVEDNENLQKIISLFTFTSIKKGTFVLKTGNRCDKLAELCAICANPL